MNTVTVTYDIFAGSSSKGLLNHFLCEAHDIDVVMCNNGPQSGHTTYVDCKKVVTQVLPMGFVCKKTLILLGAGTIIEPKILFDELEKYGDIIGDRKIFIDNMAMTLEQRHKDRERELLKHGSTFKGVGACVADRAMRLAKPFKQWLDENINDVPIGVIDKLVFCDTAEMLAHYPSYYDVLLETSQGMMLDNLRGEYPYCTSRQCNPIYALSEAGIAPWGLDELITIGILRPYPIRINNQGVDGQYHYTGNSGKGTEITWEEVAERAGYPSGVDIAEYTTVTKKKRRVFEFDIEWLKYVCEIYKPTYLCLNFANYLDYEMAKDPYIVTDKVQKFINDIERETGIPVMFVSATPYYEDYLVRNAYGDYRRVL